MAVPAKNADLHGSVPDTSSVALLLIDVVNDLEFEGGELLLPHALPMARRLLALAEAARARDIPVIYANDNFGKWRSDFKELVAHCLGPVRGRPIVELLQPRADDYFVLKPKHSAFYATPLDLLLDYLQARTLILTGLAGNLCVLFTAMDAYMRDFHLYVPRDCTASNQPEDNEHAVWLMQRMLGADVTPSTELDLTRLARGS